MGNNVFTIMSLFYSIIINASFFFKKRIKNVETNIYSYILLTNLINIIVAISFYFTELYEINDFLNNFLAKSVIICFYTFSCLFHLYVVYLSKNSNDNKKIFNNRRILILYIVFMIPIFLLPINCYHNGNVIYSYGLCANYEYLIITIMIMYWFYLFIKNFKNIVRKKCIPIFTFVTLLIIVAIIQKIRPELLLLTSLETVVIYLMYFTIENPDMKMLNELHKSKKISDSANDEKNLFIYNMTQESRKVTSNINEIVNNILDMDNLEEIREQARNILNETTKYSGITYDILGADTTTNNFKLYKTKYNLKTLIKELVGMNSKKVKNKNLKFITNIDNNIPEILFGDSIKIKEAVNELIDYNLEKTTKGTIEFNVSSIIKENVCRLFLTVECTNFGMTSEELTKELNTQTSLSDINKKIIKLNGAMSVTSSIDVGSKYKIILDQVIEKEDTEIKKYEYIYDNIKILAVDDSEAGLQIINKLLKDSDNVKLDTCNNVREVINKIKENEKYDIILIDEELESIHGYELLNELKKIRNFNIKCILLTKDNNFEYNEEYKNLGFDDYLLKPLKKDKLLNKINDIIKGDN